MISWSQKMLAMATLAMMPPIAPVASADEPRSDAGQMLERLRNEAVAEWRAMAQQLSDCEFEYTIVETERRGADATERTKRVTGQVADKCFLFKEAIAATQQVSVYGRNERYEFALSRNGDAPWTVNWQSTRQDEDTPVGSAYAYLGGMLHLPWSISATPLEKLVAHPRFSIRAVRHRDHGLVQIDFIVAPPGALEDDLQGLSSGTVVLDTTRRWAITHYQVNYANRLAISATLAYGEPGPPEISHVHFELQTRPGRTSVFDVHAAKYDWDAEPNPEFTLPAFGCPDYQDPADRRRWLKLVNIGIILVLTGIIIWRRRRETFDATD
jgi:hypothetical protein